MRALSTSKREEIISHASLIFANVGYERATMAEISARVGGSKATLYRYFPSKKELFLEVANTAAREHFGENLIESAQSKEDVAQKLHYMGARLLAFLLSRETIDRERMVIAEAGQSDIGQHYFTKGPEKGMAAFNIFFADAIAKGWLRQEDPQVVTAHAFGLLTSEISPQRLFGAPLDTSPAALLRMVAKAVDTFMRAYAT